ncbi:olfactory receptor 472-like [Bombina bombina]|uniref:olfactory receptor 472-like n=1 Tax=Bombina bombina TaxID=8345 RepID=UPI00235A94E2|nr:olfactory receptor 472-like [Bombina bombina]
MLHDNQTVITEVWIEGLQDLNGIRIFLFLIIFTVYTVILAGNMLVISMVISKSNLHTPMYFFLSNLSISELIFTTNIVPKFLQILWARKCKIPLTECLTQLYICGSIAATECFLLAAMSYDRYVAICNPLHYNYFMSFSICYQLAAWCWIGGFSYMLTTLILVCQLHFCGPNIIDHFFCDFAPMLEISCSDVSIVQLEVFISSSLVTLFPFTFIIGTYVYIILTILKIPTTTGRQKSFSTCSSHLTIVTIFYGTLITVYVIPSRGKSNTINKILSLMYTIVTPMFNPVIYSLRNQGIRKAIVKDLNI